MRAGFGVERLAWREACRGGGGRGFRLGFGYARRMHGFVVRGAACCATLSGSAGVAKVATAATAAAAAATAAAAAAATVSCYMI